ncbi:C2 and GRAM domain-containing protein At5g50170-like isoform X2 [Magnolia sinica]|uniref:C2 and GRAM domain-containing protein At5g50170-like isoform X2 n=1 Tax=Magnolia sinica TaxID=86752 RepID=UPI00265894AA|nr:C2 and GRAM domain-containing protein At5g50170-like isoform X2 [Magnolia sinica]
MTKIHVYVLEARDLPPSDGGRTDSYVKLRLGKYEARTRVVRKTSNPIWNEEFIFRVDDQDDLIVISVYIDGPDHHHHHLDGRFFNGRASCFVGQVRIPISTVLAEEKQMVPPTWFSLCPKHGKSNKTNKDTGKIFLTMSLYGRNNDDGIIHCSPTCVRLTDNVNSEEMENPKEASHEILSHTTPDAKMNLEKSAPVPQEKQSVQALAGRLMQKLLTKNGESYTSVSSNHDSSEFGNTLSDCGNNTSEPSASCTFEEAMERMRSEDEEHDEMPEDLQGGILVDQTYMISSKDLNTFLFAPNSQFRKDLAQVQGTMDMQEGSWTWECGEILRLRRVVTYTKAATKLVKAVKAVEEQSYLKADGKEFAVLMSVSTPDVPYGNCFKIELLYKIMPGPELSSGEESSRLIISWNINFFQSTVMKGMIEGGARQGLKESYEQFANLLAQNIKPVDPAELLFDKKQALASLQMEHQSDWELAVEYFWNVTVVSTIFMGLYVLVHILLSGPSTRQGLEFNGLDLPDTLGELVSCGILVLQGQCIFNMISHFLQARLQRGSDHGVKAQGDGWLLTVALIEGENFASVDSDGLSDPYVVFTCNGKTRTSSVKLQTRNPQWNEILEFDAMEEPPSVLDVEAFDFDGPFYQAGSLGHAEINFLKHTSAELADIWVPLEGKLAQVSQTKLHLRIFLDNSKGAETIREYLMKMEKEVGKKLNLQSPQRNLTFQKLFGLPPDEFLINDFSCYLKRKLPLQGRLFLSARIIGFYANLFWHKTKFFFLWEDIEDIQVIPPSLASVGSPSLIIILREGRGFDARHGAKTQDEQGRLRFHFQSFGSFSVASRTIMALWRTRTLTPDQKAPITDDQQDQDEQIEDTGSFPGIEDSKMSKMNSLMEIFDGGPFDRKIMGKVGCLNYNVTPWEAVSPDVYERHISYKFYRYISIFGGDVTSTQKKAPLTDGNGWIVDEVMTLHDVPFGDHFRVHLRYQIEAAHDSVPQVCQCQVYVGIVWLKSTKFQKRITRNISDKFTHHLKEIFELSEREILLANPRGNAI